MRLPLLPRSHLQKPLAVQPLLVGQAISVLRQEASLPWLAALPVPVALRLLVGLLLVAVLAKVGGSGFMVCWIDVQCSCMSEQQSRAQTNPS